jgi:hypothetical protein
MQEGINNVSANVQKWNRNFEAQELSSQQRRIRKWLSALDPSTDLKEAQKLHLKGSGQWFLNGSAFASWKTIPKAMLWLRGIAGCGKTIISSTIITVLQADEEQQHSTSFALAFFFFSFRDVEKQTAEQCVRSLIMQLSKQVLSGSDDVLKLFQAKDDGEKQPT